MNNSVFGKTRGNLWKRVNVKLVSDKNKLLKLWCKPTYVSSKIINKDLVTVDKIKETLKLNRPSYVGVCILDLRKSLMYETITIALRKITEIDQSYYLQILIVWLMKFKQKIFMKIFGKINFLFDNNDYSEDSLFWQLIKKS